MFLVTGKQKTAEAVLSLFLCFLEHDVLAESLAILFELDFLFYGLTVLASRVDFASFLIS